MLKRWRIAFRCFQTNSKIQHLHIKVEIVLLFLLLLFSQRYLNISLNWNRNLNLILILNWMSNKLQLNFAVSHDWLGQTRNNNNELYFIFGATYACKHVCLSYSPRPANGAVMIGIGPYIGCMNSPLYHWMEWLNDEWKNEWRNLCKYS